MAMLKNSESVQNDCRDGPGRIKALTSMFERDVKTDLKPTTATRNTYCSQFPSNSRANESFSSKPCAVERNKSDVGQVSKFHLAYRNRTGKELDHSSQSVAGSTPKASARSVSFQTKVAPPLPTHAAKRLTDPLHDVTPEVLVTNVHHTEQKEDCINPLNCTATDYVIVDSSPQSTDVQKDMPIFDEHLSEEQCCQREQGNSISETCCCSTQSSASIRSVRSCNSVLPPIPEKAPAVMTSADQHLLLAVVPPQSPPRKPPPVPFNVTFPPPFTLHSNEPVSSCLTTATDIELNVSVPAPSTDTITNVDGYVPPSQTISKTTSSYVPPSPTTSGTSSNIPFNTLVPLPATSYQSSVDSIYVDMSGTKASSHVVESNENLRHLPSYSSQSSGLASPCGSASLQDASFSFDDDSSSLYSNEPIYQMYSSRVALKSLLITLGADDDVDDDDSDDDSAYDSVCEIDRFKSVGILIEATRRLRSAVCKSGLMDEAEQLKLALDSLVASGGPVTRRLWSETARVKESGVLQKLNSKEKKLQEALFEIITSEVSYVKSLDVVVSHYMNSVVGILTTEEFRHLFSNMKAVDAASHKMLKELEGLWVKNFMLNPADVCRAVKVTTEQNSDVYVRYCSNMVFQERALVDIKKRPNLAAEFEKLENCEVSHKQTLQSYLVLPMQRVTRMGLLVANVMKLVHDDPRTSRSETANVVLSCLSTVNAIIKRCNDGATEVHNLEQLNDINRHLVFNKMKTLPIIQHGRTVLKIGDLTQINATVSRHPVKTVIGVLSKTTQVLHLILFNDILLITKKKGGSQYEVLVQAERSHIFVAELNTPAEISAHINHVPKGCENLMILTVCQANSGNIDYVFACKQSSDRTRWIEAVRTNLQCTDDRIYDISDCPQVQTIVAHVAVEADELDLAESDIVSVLRKSKDGWYEGERLRDGKRGWFRSSYTVEIENEHVRRRIVKSQLRALSIVR